MIEIPEQEARKLIVSGAAGYWSIHPKTVVLEHEKQTVIRLRGKWFLADSSEFVIKYLGEAGVLAGKVKGAFEISSCNEEINRMAKEEIEQRGVTMQSSPQPKDQSYRWN